ncbi:hypothetical protein CFI00_10370 [Nocardioides sp. S5]|uniref:hypothetical protein n=1 Tax=Nocardioides sp. S5 TaxID=2017486 RepID=UPI001A8CFC62|nr:hypothetical protein [Nocardioides sp. S5]QSR30891.1 hypothetical protein CFI00_10370 [Nocardioides sp. S5]
MTDWGVLEHAYGPAGDVPDLLAAAERSGTEPGSAWDELWSRLCHQGTVYPASHAGLSHLAAIAERQGPAGYVAALDLASAIIASTDGPVAPDVVRHQHAGAIRRLCELAERNLPHASTDTELIHALQALVAFEDLGVWQRHLEGLADGALPLTCPRCGAFLVADLSGVDPHVRDDTDASVPTTAVRPADPSEGSLGARLIGHAGDHPTVVHRLRHALGEGACPACGEAFLVEHALA